MVLLTVLLFQDLYYHHRKNEGKISDILSAYAILTINPSIFPISPLDQSQQDKKLDQVVHFVYFVLNEFL